MSDHHDDCSYPEHLDLEAKVSQLENEVEYWAKITKRESARTAELEAQLEKVRQDKARNDRDYLGLSAEHAASMGRIAQLEEKLQVHQEWHKMAGNENAALKDTLKAVRGELEAKYRFMVDSAQQNGRERDAATERVGELTQLNRKLVDALGDVFALMSFESGPFLGRITDHDGEPGWAMRMIEPMAKLKAAHAVLDEAKEALNSSPRQDQHPCANNRMLYGKCEVCGMEANRPAPTAQVCEHGSFTRNERGDWFCRHCKAQMEGKLTHTMVPVQATQEGKEK